MIKFWRLIGREHQTWLLRKLLVKLLLTTENTKIFHIFSSIFTPVFKLNGWMQKLVRKALEVKSILLEETYEVFKHHLSARYETASYKLIKLTSLYLCFKAFRILLHRFTLISTNINFDYLLPQTLEARFKIREKLIYTWKKLRWLFYQASDYFYWIFGLCLESLSIILSEHLVLLSCILKVVGNSLPQINFELV